MILNEKLKSQLMSQENTFRGSALCVILKYRLQGIFFLIGKVGNFSETNEYFRSEIYQIIIFLRYGNFHFEPYKSRSI